MKEPDVKTVPDFSLARSRRRLLPVWSGCGALPGGSVAAGGFSTAASGVARRQFSEAENSGIDQQAAPVDEHLRLTRSGLDHGRPLEHSRDPDLAILVESGEVGEDQNLLLGGHLAERNGRGLSVR